MPEHLDVVRFVVGAREIQIAWTLAAELTDRCTRSDNAITREVADRMRAVGATRPVALTSEQLVALLTVLERWEIEAETGRLLRLAIADELGV